MENKLNKVSVINQAIQNSSVAIKKGASVELINSKIVYFLIGKKTNGTYKMRSSYREILFMLHSNDIKKIMSL